MRLDLRVVHSAPRRVTLKPVAGVSSYERAALEHPDSVLPSSTGRQDRLEQAFPGPGQLAELIAADTQQLWNQPNQQFVATVMRASRP